MNKPGNQLTVGQEMGLEEQEHYFEDDFYQLNQREADDYINEGNDYDNDTPLGQEYGDGFDPGNLD